jgi:hypothetical protein
LARACPALEWHGPDADDKARETVKIALRFLRRMNVFEATKSPNIPGLRGTASLRATSQGQDDEGLPMVPANAVIGENFGSSPGGL